MPIIWDLQILKYFPYRHALLEEVYFSVPRDWCVELENKLAQMLGRHKDNHCIYVVQTNVPIQYVGTKNPNGLDHRHVVAIFFSDNVVRFGFGVKEEIW